MSSWFSNFTASDALGKLSEISSKVQEVSADVSSKVQKALPLDDELIKKLTLRTDDLKAEHSLIDAQETRKEAVRDYLSNLLPWETKDEAREILVEECKEAMNKMAEDGQTFTSPFDLSESEGRMFAEDSGKEEASEESKDEAAKKLEKMGPLPQLLDEFDLDAHVGLIERLFKVDKELVRSHSQLESAGKSEKIFWKNYFFHCAFIRYEKGLSVDEIWAIQAETSADVEKAVVDSASRQSLDDTGSVELTFEHDDDEAEEEDDDDDATGPGNASATKSTTSEYEMVDDLSEKMDDEELDELDAEIAKELAEIDDL